MSSTTTDKKRQEVEELRAEMGRQLGYTLTLNDPIMALAYASKQMQEDQHAALLEQLARMQYAARQVTAEGQKQITQHIAAMTEMLGDEMRAWVNPQSVAERVVEGCGDRLARDIATSVRGHLEGEEERLRDLVAEAMVKHDEQLLWHVNRQLDHHTRIGSRNALAVAVVCVLMMAACTVVFYQGSTLQRQVRAVFAAEAPPLPPQAQLPAAAMLAPRSGHADR